MNVSADRIRALSVAVYKRRLEDPTGGGKGAVARMLAKDDDGGVKLESRAAAYDVLVRCMLAAIEDAGVDLGPLS